MNYRHLLDKNFDRMQVCY